MIKMDKGIFKRVKDFNIDRNLLGGEFDVKTEVSNLLEEVEELADAKMWQEQVDALCDIIVFAIGGLYKLDVCPEEAMLETLKEIESRKQDPIQAHEWSENGPEGKWMKNKQQCPETLYEANYRKVTTCI